MEKTSAQAAYDAAMREIRKGLDKRAGGDGAEARMAEAYKMMVREGTAPALRPKYTNGKALKQVR